MKNLYGFCVCLIALISCENPENEIAVDSSSFEQTTIDLTTSDGLQNLKNLAMEFKSTANGQNGQEIDKSIALRLLALSDLMMTEYQIRNNLILASTQKSSINLESKGCSLYGYTACQEPYNNCVWWAKSWDDLLKKCNGPYPLNNCDQIRNDYIKNLDKIEQTYMKCRKEWSECLDRYCPKGPSTGPQY